jgi:plastocyanin
MDSYTPVSYYTNPENSNSSFFEEKASSSHYGDSIDIWAPGTAILSSVNSNESGSVTDSRNGQSGVAAGTWYNNIKSGTSMASPQVCGIAALYAQRYPYLNNDSLLEFLYTTSRENQLAEIRYLSWNVTASGTSAYVLTPRPSGTAQSDPTLTVRQSDVLTFFIDSGGSHPFSIVSSTSGGWNIANEVSGVTNQGATSGTVTWNLKDVAPGTYRYICRNHSTMVGNIIVQSDQRANYGYLISGGVNKHVFYKPIRGLSNTQGSVWQEYTRVAYPSNEFTPRKSSGISWPRRKRRY